MITASRILIVCTAASQAQNIVDEIQNPAIDSVSCTSLAKAIKILANQPFDMLIVESQVGGSDGLAFLAESKQRLPTMLRVIIEIEPILINMQTLINDVAPSAIFDKCVNVEKIEELLELKHRSDRTENFPADGSMQEIILTGDKLTSDSSSLVQSETEKLEFLTDISVLLNGMMEDPNISLPVLPEIAMKVRDVLADDQCTFEELGKLIELEQGMSARLLQLANSPIYAGKERIRNLDTAVSRLGIRETRNILTVVISQNLFATNNKAMMDLMRRLWLHSLCVAYGNEMIAQRLEIKESSDFFMMGLTHDIGKLLIIKLIEKGHKENVWEGRNITLDIMNRLLKMRHNDLGARLLEKWTFPISIREVVRLHNDTTNISLRSEGIIVTHYSNLLSRKVGLSLIPHEENSKLSKKLVNSLNISESVQRDIEISMEQLTTRIESSFLI